jgi:hypothetical protein
VFPQRWWYLGVGAVLGLMVGAALAARITDSDTASTLWGGGLGAIAGILFGVAVITAALPHDARLIGLRRRFPDALVLQALRDDDNVAVLDDVAKRPASTRFCVVFDGAGASVWDSADVAEPLVSFPWAQIGAITVGGMVRPTRLGTRAYFRLVVALLVRGETVVLPFGVERVPAFPGGRTTLSDGELEVLAERLTEVRPTT